MEEEATYNGLPYKGRREIFDKDDPLEFQPKKSYESHLKVFSTSKEEDVTELEELFTKARQNKTVIEDTDRQYDPEKKEWNILVVWSDKIYTSSDRS